MKAIHLNRQTLFKLGDVLREHCHFTATGWAKYDEPWTDELIAEKFGAPVHTGHVRRLREELIGKHEPNPRLYNQWKLKDDIAELKKHVDELEAWAAARKLMPYKYGEE